MHRTPPRRPHLPGGIPPLPPSPADLAAVAAAATAIADIAVAAAADATAAAAAAVAADANADDMLVEAFDAASPARVPAPAPWLHRFLGLSTLAGSEANLSGSLPVPPLGAYPANEELRASPADARRAVPRRAVSPGEDDNAMVTTPVRRGRTSDREKSRKVSFKPTVDVDETKASRSKSASARRVSRKAFKVNKVRTVGAPPAGDDESTLDRVDTVIQEFETEVTQEYATLQQVLGQDDEAPTTVPTTVRRVLIDPTLARLTMQELNAKLEEQRIQAIESEMNQELAGSEPMLGEDVRASALGADFRDNDAHVEALKAKLKGLEDLFSRRPSVEVSDRMNRLIAAISRIQDIRAIQEPPPHLPSTSSEESNDTLASIAGREEIQEPPHQESSDESDMFPGFNTDEISSLEGTNSL